MHFFRLAVKEKLERILVKPRLRLFLAVLAQDFNFQSGVFIVS